MAAGSIGRPDSEPSWSAADCRRSPFHARSPHGTSLVHNRPSKSSRTNRAPRIEELKAGIEALEVAMRWTPSGLRLTNLAMFELELATRLSPGDAQRANLLERSGSNLVEGLLQNPCDSYAWLRLAIVQNYRGLPARKVAAPQMASLDVAPNLRGLWSTRAEYLLFYSTVLTSEELYEVRHQLRTIWSEATNVRLPLVRIALRVDRSIVLT